jgi:hypothetical protein
MDKIYYYTGIIVIWLFIAAVIIVLSAITYSSYYNYIYRTDWFSFYIRRTVLPSDTIRKLYPKCKGSAKHYSHLYRLRNIRRIKGNNFF